MNPLKRWALLFSNCPGNFCCSFCSIVFLNNAMILPLAYVKYWNANGHQRKFIDKIKFIPKCIKDPRVGIAIKFM